MQQRPPWLHSTLPSIIRFQETKLTNINSLKAASLLPALHANSFTYLGSAGASGGLLCAWDASFITMERSVNHEFSMTTIFKLDASGTTIAVTNCYGPCTHGEKGPFLDELWHIHTNINSLWVVLQDFNLVRLPEERSNDSFNSLEAAMFNEAIDDLELVEIPLNDRCFNWSNHQAGWLPSKC